MVTALGAPRHWPFTTAFGGEGLLARPLPRGLWHRSVGTSGVLARAQRSAREQKACEQKTSSQPQKLAQGLASSLLSPQPEPHHSLPPGRKRSNKASRRRVVPFGFCSRRAFRGGCQPPSACPKKGRRQASSRNLRGPTTDRPRTPVAAKHASGSAGGEVVCVAGSEIPRTCQMRTPGVQPGSQAWEACVIPLHYVRTRNWPQNEGMSCLTDSKWPCRAHVR